MSAHINSCSTEWACELWWCRASIIFNHFTLLFKSAEQSQSTQCWFHQEELAGIVTNLQPLISSSKTTRTALCFSLAVFLSFNCECISDLFHLTTLTMKDQRHDFDSDLGKKGNWSQAHHMTLKSFLFYMTVAVFGKTRVRFLSSQHTKSGTNCTVLITDVCVDCSYSSPVLKFPPKQSIIQI